MLSNSSINYGDDLSAKRPITINARIRKGRDFVLGVGVEAIVTAPDGKVGKINNRLITLLKIMVLFLNVNSLLVLN